MTRQQRMKRKYRKRVWLQKDLIKNGFCGFCKHEGTRYRYKFDNRTITEQTRCSFCIEPDLHLLIIKRDYVAVRQFFNKNR